jgi:hypothetical protein
VSPVDTGDTLLSLEEDMSENNAALSKVELESVLVDELTALDMNGYLDDIEPGEKDILTVAWKLAVALHAHFVEEN